MPDLASGWDEPTYLSDAELASLARLVDDAGNIANELPESLRKYGPGIFSHALWNLTYLSFDREEAQERFAQAVLHARQISQVLGRDIGLALAAADYFAHVTREISSPRLIDLDLSFASIKPPPKIPSPGSATDEPIVKRSRMNSLEPNATTSKWSFFYSISITSSASTTTTDTPPATAFCN